jgi:hypothetical protein
MLILFSVKLVGKGWTGGVGEANLDNERHKESNMEEGLLQDLPESAWD